jgi:hypothetical protein
MRRITRRGGRRGLERKVGSRGRIEMRDSVYLYNNNDIRRATQVRFHIGSLMDFNG